jgi:UDP-N-acetyl-D-mannosaminuronic acid dehydrogenase
MEPIKTVGVIGMGYVGIASAVLFATHYQKVYGFQRRSDSSGYKIDMLNQGVYPLKGEEPELPGLLAEVAFDNTFECTSDFSKLALCDAITIAVQTPFGSTTPLMEAVMSIGKWAKPGTLVSIESTVSPGTTEAIQGLLQDCVVVHVPERVMPGRLLKNLREHDRIIGGSTSRDIMMAVQLYHPILTTGRVITMSAIAAEVTKTAENAFRDLQIAAVNQLALYCEEFGVNVYDVRNGIDSLKGIGITRAILNPGAGVGGHCLPKDTYLLVNNIKGKIPSLFLLARSINDYMPAHMYEMLVSALEEAGVRHPKIALLGWSFAPNTGDVRNAPSKVFMDLAMNAGMEVVVHDPYVWEHKPLESVVAQADAVVIFTAHDEYYSLNPQYLKPLMRTPIVIDGRNIVDPEEFTDTGFIYKGIGRGDFNVN